MRAYLSSHTLLCATLLFTALSFACACTSVAQTRDEMVREDKRKVTEDGFWIYNDLPKAFDEAKESGKPILVVLRCIPCHECVKLDDDLVDKDPVIRPLLDQFVCARQVSTNGLDLQLFQYDTDQSFAVFMLNADGTIYGRFGTRSHRTEWIGDVSLEGLAAALQSALKLHEGYPKNRELLAGKNGGNPEVASPEKYPSLAGKFTDALNYQGDVAKSCIHCHQIGEAQRAFYWQQGKMIPEQILFPYPHPKSLGLILDPKKCSTVKSIDPDSLAETSGLKPGDVIESFGDQQPLSIADVQWVLHQSDGEGVTIPIRIARDGKSMDLEMNLDSGWRRNGDLSWRTTSWGYRRMVAGGLRLGQLDADERKERQIPPQAMALLVTHVGQYGAHAAAKKAGFRKGDVLLSYDGKNDLPSESALFAYGLENHRAGDHVSTTVLRDGKQIELTMPIQR